MSLTLDLLAVSVGLPAPLGLWQGEVVSSGIRKLPVTAPHVTVTALNIAGDGQADLAVHGGVDKAVYAYPADHWPWWQAETGLSAAAATFGENLTLRGADEHDVRIGDRFMWGEVALEISQPRGPCYKLGLLTGRPDDPARMTISTRTGWYFRVLKEGQAPTTGTLTRTHSNETEPTVHEAFIAIYRPRVMSNIIEKVLASPKLSPMWRHGLQRRLDAAKTS